MKLFKYLAELLCSPRRTVKQIPPTSAAAVGMPAMFQGAKKTTINGGVFTIENNRNMGNEHPLDILNKRVAPHAILNTGGRADQVGCHPGTREEVIHRIEEWANRQDSQTPPIFWLSGPAGAGKSAIMQTVAERCKHRMEAQANFFFFRADSSRSTVSPLVATLLYQIIRLYSSVRESVATVLTNNPLIFESSLEDQLEELIVAPLRFVQESSPAYRPILLVVDGLDECDSETKRNQQQILDAFDHILVKCQGPCPFRLLVASRDEFHIHAAFHKLSSKWDFVYLDSHWFPDRDIRVYVQSQFEQVKRTHPLAYNLDARWPSEADVSYIVEKSSGQFVYATTVMGFILDSPASPSLSLERVQGVAPYTTRSPFAQLDSIYSYILSRADDQEALKDILHAQLLKGTPTAEEYYLLEVSTSPHNIPLVEILAPYNQKYTEEVVVSCMADLKSIAQYDSNRGGLVFHHKSFSDYLLDQSRSGEYFVDTATFNYKIMTAIWSCINKAPTNQMLRQFGLYGLSLLLQLPPSLMDLLVLSQNVWSHLTPQQSSIFNSIRNLCFDDDDLRKFRVIFREWLDSRNLDDAEFIRHTSHIPFIQRYRQMDRADSFILPDGVMKRALSSDIESDVDRRESALWLSDLLHRAHREIYPHDPERYEKLLKEWIAWVVLNDIPHYDLYGLPGAYERIKKRMAVHHRTIDSSFSPKY